MAAVSIGFIVVQVWLDLKSPDYMAEITTLVQTPGSAMNDIWIAGAMMLLCTLGSLVAAVFVGFYAAVIGSALSRRLRKLLFSRVDSFSMEEINRFTTDSLITRSTNDITQVQMIVAMGLQLVIKAPITAAWAITKIAGKGLEWTMATGAAVLIMLITFVLIMHFVMPKFRMMQSLIDNMNRVTRENLTGLRVVRAYNAGDYQEAKFEQANDGLTGTQLYTSRAMAIVMPIMTIIMSGISLSVFWIGAYLINAAQAADRLPIFSNMMVFSIYAMQIIMSFMMLMMIFAMLPRATVSAKRICEVLDTEATIHEGTLTEGLPGLIGEVTFKNVGFKYPEATKPVLKDISFTVKQGETIAFIGSTGSGKSTLVNLVPRFFDTTEGEILVDGVNVRDYKFDALYNKIGYVPQKAVLFKGSVYSNVAYGDKGKSEFTDYDVKLAVSVAQGVDIVESMENGYHADIAQGGTNISGGQKQRLAIARAVCRKPEIYIFDDSFSALDYRTDRLLRTMLKEETKGVTSMIVAQRIGTIIDADRIIVLDEGKIVGCGKHKDLLKNCDVYKEIAISQLSEEELGEGGVAS